MRVQRAQPDLRARFPTHPSPVALRRFATCLVFVVFTICTPSFERFTFRSIFQPKFTTSERARMPWATSRKVGTRQAGLNPQEIFYSLFCRIVNFYFEGTDALGAGAPRSNP